MDDVNYSIRESRRAKKVILKMSLHSGLEIVIPYGFDRKRIPGIIKKRKEWLDKTARKLESAHVYGPESSKLPIQIELKATGRSYTVSYLEQKQDQISFSEDSTGIIQIKGNIHNKDKCRLLLIQWLKNQGAAHLGPLVRLYGRQTGLEFNKVQIRNQKSRWGSCSRRGTISLNCKLMFFPPSYVKYIVLHELCHTVQLNHSPDFWKCLGRFEPDFRELDKKLNLAWKYVPLWAY